MKNLLRAVVLLIVLWVSGHVVNAGTFYSFKAGDFSDRNNWSTTATGPQTVPTSGAWGSNSGWDNVLIIQHAMTLAGGSYEQWGNSTSVTINSGGSLKRTGTLSLRGSGIKIINSGGTFEVTGFLTLDGTIFSFASGSNIIGGFSITSSGSSSFTNAGTLTINGSADISSAFTNSGTMTVTGSLTKQNTGGAVTNSGTLTVQTNVSALGLIQLDPAASSSSIMTINGSLTVNDNPWIVVGSNVSSCSNTITNYANLIVKGSVSLTGAGDITVNQTGRFIVFGNIAKAPASTGNVITINCGGQAYVNGNIDVGTGGGGTVQNNNSSSSPTGSNGSPIIGLYVNGSTTAQHSGGSYGTIGTKNDLQSNNNNFFTYIASISGSPLPISLSFFKVGEVNSEGVGLLWETKSELNFDYFNLQRSVNGKDFETIAEVQGHGTTKVSHEYSFTDKLALNGTSYYRLQSVDFDKYTETFNVVSVRYETGKNASVYPNPVTDSNLNFQLNFQPTTEILVTVTSMTGIERVREVIKANETSLNLGLSLEPGIYIVKMASMDFNKVSRIVVK